MAPSPARPASNLLFLLGAVFLISGLLAFGHTANYVKTSQTATGSVVKLVLARNTASNRGVLYYPIFTFRTPDGMQHFITSNSGSNPAPYRVGDPVTVLYQPDFPESGKISSFGALWALPDIFMGVGLLMLVVGFVVRRFATLGVVGGAVSYGAPTGLPQTLPREFVADGGLQASAYQSVSTRRGLGRGAWVMLLVGSVFCVSAAVQAVHTVTFVRSAQEAHGTVIRVDIVYPSHTQPMCVPVITFRTAAGAQQTVTSKVGTNPPAFRVGQAVEVLYDPAHPDSARISSLSQLWMVPLALGGLGLGAVLMGLIFLRSSKTR